MSRAARYVSAETPEPQHRPPAGKPGRGFASLRPFRHRAFALLWTAGLISTVGSWMQTVAVGALVISDTGRATWAVLVANAVSFLAVVVALAFVRLAPPAGRSDGLLASLRSGFKAARGEPSCWAAIGTIAVVALLASPFIALVPVMAHHLTRGGPRAVAQTTALLTTAQGAGAVVGALCLAPLAYRLGRGRLLAWSLALLPVVLVAYSSSQSPWPGAAAIFVVRLVYIGGLAGLSTVVQLRAPEAYRGRILAFFLVALGVAYPIGSLIQGPVIDRIRMGWATAGAAGLLALIMLVVALSRPGIARAITSGADSDPAASFTGLAPADPGSGQT